MTRLQPHATMVVGCLLFAGFSVRSHADAPPAPPMARAVGYTLSTFASDFTPATVDTKVTKAPGFKWYNWDLFGKQSDPDAVQLNPDGSATFTGERAQLLSAVHIGKTGDFVGTSFGGGAYIEAEMKLGVATPDPGAKSWPAFWALQMEGNVIPNASQWEGQEPGYIHSIEVDFFEYQHRPGIENLPATTYGSALHDWYGVYNKTCGHGLCGVGTPYGIGQKHAPPGTDMLQYHRYGFLWVPATERSKGYAKYFFDGAQIGATQEWTMLKDQPPPPTNQPWLFGIMDRQHLFLIINTGAGQPFYVRSVNVWQASTANNWTR